MSDVKKISDEQSTFVFMNVQYCSVVSRQCLTVDLSTTIHNKSRQVELLL